MICGSRLDKKYYKDGAEIPALDQVTFTVEKGEFVVVQGPSGCGKTTLLLTLGGLLHPDSGTVLIDQEDLYAKNPEGRATFRATHIGFVFQHYHLIPYLTVLENVMASCLGQADPATEADALILLKTLGLEGRTRHKPAELSAGEKQRTALARALLGHPAVVLADELTGNLDPQNGRVVLERLKQFSISGGTVFLATHDEMANPMADRTFRMEKGKINPG